ncbi:MAG: carbohydrate kinase, partial [Clostridia bacterium]|nr:carbohydrate kinase [Clostridia bacterium]
MSKYLLSVDNGLTTTKAVIFTLEGKEVASSHVNTLIENNGDFVEIDMELQWANTAKVIKKCISKSEVDPREIVGVGNSGHGAGLYCLDESNRPVRKAISSMDARASSIIENWTKNGLNSYSRIYQSFWSGQAIPLLSWLKNNEPESYGNIRSILMVKDWIIYCLTGSVGIEYTDASNSGLINPVDKKVDKELFGMFEVEEVYEKIPKLRKTTDIAGYVTKRAEEETGLMVGTPVIGGVFDCIACALGSGVYHQDKYSIIAGTWNI